MIWKRDITKIVTEKEYDDIEQNRIINVDVINKLKLFGVPIFTRHFNEDLKTVDGGVYKEKEKKGIGFNAK